MNEQRYATLWRQGPEGWEEVAEVTKVTVTWKHDRLLRPCVNWPVQGMTTVHAGEGNGARSFVMLFQKSGKRHEMRELHEGFTFCDVCDAPLIDLFSEYWRGYRGKGCARCKGKSPTQPRPVVFVTGGMYTPPDGQPVDPKEEPSITIERPCPRCRARFNAMALGARERYGRILTLCVECGYLQGYHRAFDPADADDSAPQPTGRP